jgi:HSP20 family protein
MPNLAIRKHEGGPIFREDFWPDPIRRVRDLLRWDPFAELSPLAFEPILPSHVPAFEVKDTKDSYVFKADVPGVKEQDLNVEMSGDRLTVSGKREVEQKEKEETYFTYELSYGAFTRTFTLPQGTNPDLIRAELKEGVLTIVVPKGAAFQPKKVMIKGVGEKAKA